VARIIENGSIKALIYDYIHDGMDIHFVLVSIYTCIYTIHIPSVYININISTYILIS